jgi:hypothetical protein
MGVLLGEGREEEEEGQGVGQLGDSPWGLLGGRRAATRRHWAAALYVVPFCEEGNRKKEKRREEREEKKEKMREKIKEFFSNLEISEKIKDILRSWLKIIFVEERYLPNYK